MKVSGYQKCAAFSLLCAPVKHWHTKEKTVQGAAAWSTETIQASDPMEKRAPLSNSTWLQPALSPWK